MRTAARVLDIFEVFATLQRPLTLSALAEALSIPVSSCFGLVRTLEERGYLHSVSDRKEWYPTRRMLQNIHAISQSEPIIGRLGPVLEALRDQTDETIILGQMAGNGLGVVYLDVFEGTQAIRYSAGIGERKPLYSTAIGKVLLSEMTPERRNSVLKRLKMGRITDRTILSVTRLAKDIEAGAARGYQMTRGENVTDVGAIAMPVRAGDRLFGVAIAGPILRLDPLTDKHAAALRSACKQIEALVG